jgi:hypothetical protein
MKLVYQALAQAVRLCGVEVAAVEIATKLATGRRVLGRGDPVGRPADGAM